MYHFNHINLFYDFITTIVQNQNFSSRYERSKIFRFPSRPLPRLLLENSFSIDFEIYS